MTGHEHIPPTSDRIPIVTGTDDVERLAGVVDEEADAIDCRSILRTR
ncbi:hypothetical protein [Streptomyces flavidovirens]